jgi:hypothetical protein
LARCSLRSTSSPRATSRSQLPTSIASSAARLHLTRIQNLCTFC